MNTQIAQENKNDDLNEHQIRIKFFAYLFLSLLGVVFITLIFYQVRWITTDKGWFLQPRITSGFGLIIFTFFALIRTLQFYRKDAIKVALNPATLANLMERYRTTAVSSFLFLIYIFSLSKIGFVISTFLFITTLIVMSRLFNKYWLVVTVFSVMGLVLIFRIGVSLWMPDVWLYEFFPNSWADFANRYL